MMTKDHKAITTFLGLAFLIPLIFLLLQKAIPNGTVNFLLFGIQAAAPTIAAIAVLTLNKELKTSLGGMFKTKHLPSAILLPIIILCVTMCLAKLIYCTAFGKGFTFAEISRKQFIIILWSLIAEEIGWRGFLAPHLERSGMDRKLVPCIVGVIWCLWHYRYLIQGNISIPIWLFFISCIIESYIYSLLMTVTENNIASAMCFHFIYNLLIHLAAINPEDNGGSIYPYAFMTALEGAALIVFAAAENKNHNTSA